MAVRSLSDVQRLPRRVLLRQQVGEPLSSAVASDIADYGESLYRYSQPEVYFCDVRSGAGSYPAHYAQVDASPLFTPGGNANWRALVFRLPFRPSAPISAGDGPVATGTESVALTLYGQDFTWRSYISYAARNSLDGEYTIIDYTSESGSISTAASSTTNFTLPTGYDSEDPTHWLLFDFFFRPTLTDGTPGEISEIALYSRGPADWYTGP